MYQKNFMIFGTHKPHKATHEMVLIL